MFLILVVLYNKTIDSSLTLKGILECKDFLNTSQAKLFLWDNSLEILPCEQNSLLEKSITNYEYVHAPQNLPLSKIYNRAIEVGLNQEAFKYLILLDDDSMIDGNFFVKAFEAVKENHSLVLPIIRNKEKIRSPMRYYPLKAFFFPNLQPGILSSKNLMAINSGMIISFDFLRKTNFKYDEKFKNYGTDNFFMRFYAKHSSNVYILDYSFNHSLSFFDDPNINKKLQIFKQHKQVMLYIHSDNVFDYVMALTSNLLSSLKNCIKYKSYQFLK